MVTLGQYEFTYQKSKKIPCQEKFSAPPKDDPQKLGFLRCGSAENGGNGKNCQKWVEHK